MPFIPLIHDYKPFYVQAATDQAATDILQTYGIVVQKPDYPIARTPKEPYKNDWHDEHGDDEWLGAMYYQAFTFKLQCVILGQDETDASHSAVLSQIRSFQTKIGGGEIKVYDSWNKTGFQKVRLSNFSDASFESFGGRCRAFFSVEFKVNDPVTAVSFTNGAIVAST